MARKRNKASGAQDQNASEQQPVQQQKRTTAEINFAVLSRYVSGLHQIIDIAPFTVLYIFSAETRQWEKCGIEGSLFVCETWRDGYQGFSVVILNRKSLNNFIVDITGTNQVELTEQYVILQGVEDGAPQIYGVWIFSEEGDVPSIKDRIGDVIQGCAYAVEENVELPDEEDQTEPHVESESYIRPESSVQPDQYVQPELYIGHDPYSQQHDQSRQQYDQSRQQYDQFRQQHGPSMQHHDQFRHEHDSYRQRHVVAPPVGQSLDLGALFGRPQAQHHTQVPQIPQAESLMPSGQQLDLLKLFGGGPQVQQEQHISQQSQHISPQQSHHIPQQNHPMSPQWQGHAAPVQRYQNTPQLAPPQSHLLNLFRGPG